MKHETRIKMMTICHRLIYVALGLEAAAIGLYLIMTLGT